MKKTLSIFRKIFTVFLFILVVAIMIFTIFSVTTFNKEEGGGVFGYKFFIVLSDSMKGEFNTGDVIVVKEVDSNNIKAGDIISFKSIDPLSYGSIVTHKVREETSYEGNKAFTTYGINTGTNDPYPVPGDQILGKYSFNIAKAGYVFQFLKSPAGYFVMIFIPFFLIILLEGFRFFRLIKKYRKEKQLEIDEQKEAILVEKQKTEEMESEIIALKEELKKKNENETVNNKEWTFWFSQKKHI